jgi:thiol:disulfide interchange protein DsbC
MKFHRLLLPTALLMISACSQAEPPVNMMKETSATGPSAVSQKEEDIIRASLKKAIPDAEITAIKESPYKGLFEVKAKGYGTAYMSADGRYMLQGELIEINGDKIVNVTEQSAAGERKAALAAVPLKDMIIFPAQGKTKGIAYVFTDIDCGYCRKIHAEVPAMNQMGIEIRYLAFPRAGYPSPTSKGMDAIWCSANPNDAMTKAKQGVPIPSASCANPIKAQYELGQELGVRGTPAVFLENGMQVGGYLPPKDLAAAMGIK